MQENLIFTFLKTITEISQDSFNSLKEITEVKELKAGTQISKIGEKPTSLYLLFSGIVRVYKLSDTGKEYNKNFFLPMSFTGSLTALIKDKPSELIYETITDCKLYGVNYSELIELSRKNIQISQLYIKALESVFVSYEIRQLELISLNATERYKKLIKSIPDIEKLIAQYQIASYLSITAVQLSRIRKKIK
ncbi:Crp/Fnr family transcriptional regulator [Postechiella marina]|uniref:Crp/Fnr family transcriptional regulator n=1 Tax=Postechiella marina TaxID=943941 RepID=A0ABP8C179_9FLAO